jgi:hypothetical protein
MFPYEFIACPRCGSQMYPAVTEALPGGINKSVFSCDGCHAETERAFQSIPTRSAAWPDPVGLVPAER